MTSPLKFVLTTAAFLSPFFISTFWHFKLWLQDENMTSALLKVLPIYSLVLFVLVRGHKEHACRKWILVGLLLSSVGDVFMIWKSQLVPGMAAFALAQISYIKAFGWSPLQPVIGIQLFLCSASSLWILVPGLKHDQFLLVGLPFYCILLTTMAWRATARVFVAERGCFWIRVCTSLGALSFLISDLVIGFDRFYSPIDDAQWYIMATYYLAQVGIALSAAEPKSTKGKRN